MELIIFVGGKEIGESRGVGKLFLSLEILGLEQFKMLTQIWKLHSRAKKRWMDF